MFYYAGLEATINRKAILNKTANFDCFLFYFWSKQLHIHHPTFTSGKLTISTTFNLFSRKNYNRNILNSITIFYSILEAAMGFYEETFY